MASFFDDLFGTGSPPTNTTTSSSAPPLWYQNYLRSLIGTAGAVASEPYRPYPGQRIAPLTADQQQAFNLTRAGIGGFQPYFTQAAQDYQAGRDDLASARGAYGTAGQDFTSARGALGQAGSTLGTALGTTGQAGGYLGTGANVLGGALGDVGAARGYLGEGAGIVGGALRNIGAAEGYLGQAGNLYGSALGDIYGARGDIGTARAGIGSAQNLITGAGGPFNRGEFDQFMNPYTEGVVNRIAQLGQRNLSENLLPAVNTTFTGAGQFGSSRHADFTNRALRDANESILGQQAQALSSGYGSAMDAYLKSRGLGLQAGSALTDTARTALGTAQGAQGIGQAIQGVGGAFGNLGATAGNLAQTQAGIGSQYGNIGSAAGNLAQTQAGIGAQYGNLGQAAGQIGQIQAGIGGQYGNLGQTYGQLGQGQVGVGSAYAGLAPVSAGIGTATAGLGTGAQTAALRDAAALEAIGGTQQGIGQQNLDLAYQDFLTQRGYPQAQTNFLSNIVRGQNVGGTTTASGPGQPQPSITSQIAGLGIGGLSLYKLLGGTFAKGGRVKGYARGGRAGIGYATGGVAGTAGDPFDSSEQIWWEPTTQSAIGATATVAPAPPRWNEVVDQYRRHGLQVPNAPTDPASIAAIEQAAQQPSDPHSPSMVRLFGPATPIGSPQQSQLSFDGLMAALANGQVPQVTTAMLNRFTPAQRNQWYTAYDAANRDTSNDAPPPQVALDARLADWRARGAPMEEWGAMEAAVSKAMGWDQPWHAPELGGQGASRYVAEAAGLIPTQKQLTADNWKYMKAPATSPYFVDMTLDAQGRPINPLGYIPGSRAVEGAGAGIGIAGIADPRTALEQQLWDKRMGRPANAQEQWLAYINSSQGLKGTNKDLFDVGQDQPLTSWSFDPISNPAAFIKRLELFGYGDPGSQHGLDPSLSKAIDINERTGEIILDPSKLPPSPGWNTPVGRGGDPVAQGDRGWAKAIEKAGITGPVTLGFLPESRRLGNDFWMQYDAATQAHQALQDRFERFRAGRMSLPEMQTMVADIRRWQGGDQPYNVPRFEGAQRPVGQGVPSHPLYTTTQSQVMQAINDGKQVSPQLRREIVGEVPWESKPWLRPFFAGIGNFGIAQMAQERRAPGAVDHPILGRVSPAFVHRFEQWLKAGGGPFEKLKNASWQDAEALGYPALGSARKVGTRGNENVVRYNEEFGPFPAGGVYPSAGIGPNGITLPPFQDFDPRAKGGRIKAPKAGRRYMDPAVSSMRHGVGRYGIRGRAGIGG